MKKLIKKLPLVGFILAIGAAFAFNQPAELATVWFELDAQGNVLNEMPSAPACEDGTQYCAVSVDSGDLDQNGQPPFENVEEPGAEQYIIETRNKN